MRSNILDLFKEFWLIYLAGYVTLAAAISIFLVSKQGSVDLLSLGLLLLFGIIFGLSVYLFDNAPIYSHLYLFAESAIIMILANLHPELTLIFGVLFLPITSQAPLFLSFLPGFLWVFGFIAISAMVSSQIYGGIFWGEIALSSGGYLGFGGFGATLRASNQRRRESQVLLEELQEAHVKLKQYTEQAEELAVSEERNRLAREMHDSLGHRLTVAIVQLEGAKRLIPKEPERAATIVDHMRYQLKDALSELRKTLSSLRSQSDEMPETTDLATAVSQLVDTFQTATGLPTHLTIEPNLPHIPASHHTAIYRTVQESLTNIQRHAQANNAWVNIERLNGQIQITTTDDGQGFDGEIEDGRFGLRGIEERTIQLGGEFYVQANIPKGTKLTLLLPMQGNDHE